MTRFVCSAAPRPVLELPPLPAGEYETPKANITQHGILVPVLPVAAAPERAAPDAITPIKGDWWAAKEWSVTAPVPPTTAHT